MNGMKLGPCRFCGSYDTVVTEEYGFEPSRPLHRQIPIAKVSVNCVHCGKIVLVVENGYDTHCILEQIKNIAVEAWNGKPED